MPSLVITLVFCLVFPLLIDSKDGGCKWNNKDFYNDEIVLTNETMNGKEEIVCFHSTLESFESLQWTTNSREKIAKCNRINNYDVCTETPSSLVEILRVDSRHSSLKSASYDCGVYDYSGDLKKPQCTVKVVIKKAEPATQISDSHATTTQTAPTTSTTSYVTATSTNRRPIVRTTSYHTSSAASTTQTAPTTNTTSYVTATSKNRRLTVPTTSYHTSSAAVLNATSQTKVTTVAIVCAIIVVLTGLCIGLGLVILKKPCQRDDEENWDSASAIWEDEHRSLNGKNTIPISSITMGKLLGEGQFGTVAEGILTTQTNTGEVYTIKIAVKMFRDERQADDFQKEAKLLASLGYHKNLTRIYGHCVENGHVSKIAMEYAEMGDLHRYLRRMRTTQNEPTLDEEKTIDYGRQIAEGMQFVASKGCVHRDLAARNVLVFAGERLKICDFGLAKDLESAAYYRKRTKGGVIPFKWCAPEVLLYKTYSEYSDVWSYGIVLWEIVTYGGTPYPGVPIEKLFELLTGNLKYRMSKPRLCSHKIYEIMTYCWNSIPDQRPTFLNLTNILNSTDSKGLAYKKRPNVVGM